MSDPLVWNGSTWVRPAFWDGSAWRSYIPPVFDVDANGARYEFPADAEGWSAHTNTNANPIGWSAGAVYGDVEPGLLGYVYLQSVAVAPGPLDGNARQVYGQASVRVQSQAGATDPNPIECYIELLQSWNDPVRGSWNQTPGTDSGYVTRATPTSTVYSSNNCYLRIMADAGALSGYGTCRLWVDWARLIDATTGQVLQQLGDPGWEPTVWTGTQWV